MSERFRSSSTDPAARGSEFGERHCGRIRAGFELYAALFQRHAQRAFDLKALGGQALERIKAFAPPLHAEIIAMAAACGLEPELLGALNARTEILAAIGAPLRGECSTVVQIDPWGGAPVAVQTWDWFAEFADNWLVWEIPQADDGLTTTVTEFGVVGKIGVNRRGLGVHFNILHHLSDGEGIGVPVHVLSRWALDTGRDISHALQIIASADVSASSALTVIGATDGASAAASAEVYPSGPGIVFPGDDGLLIHTNHFLSAPADRLDAEPRAYPDTLVRHDLLSRRLAGRRGLTEAQVISAMANHLGSIGAVCCHPDPSRSPVGQYQTLATVTLDVQAGALNALAGGPCAHPSRLTPSGSRPL